MKRTLLAATCLFLLPRLASAQLAEETRVEDDWSLTFDVHGFDKADLDRAGELGISRWSIGLGQGWDVDKASTFSLFLRHEDSLYDIDGVRNIGIGAPLDGSKEDSIAMRWESASKALEWYLAGAFVSGRADGVSVSDSLYAEGTVGLLFGVTEGLDLGLAVATRTHIEEDLDLFPIPLIQWQVTEDLELATLRSADPVLRATYAWSERLSFYADLLIDQRQIRVEDSNALQDAVLVDEERGVRFGLDWHTPSFRARLYAGVSERDLTLESNDTVVGEDETNPTAMGGVSISFLL